MRTQSRTLVASSGKRAQWVVATPGTSGISFAGLRSIVDSLVGAPFSTLFFVAAIGAKLRRLASSAARYFLPHGNVDRRSGYSISFTMHQYVRLKHSRI